MQPTLLANTWVVAHLPQEKYSALLCCAGSAGEVAFRNSLDDAFMEAGYQHLPTKLKRQPIFYVVGVTENERGSFVPSRRIARCGDCIGAGAT